MMKTTHKLAIGGVLIGAVASMTSPIAANAAPEPPSGAYQYTDQIPGEPDSSATWHFNPCGPDCTVLTNAEGTGSGLFVNWKFQLSNGRWTYSGQQQEDCSIFGNGMIPIAIKASFDAATLTGQWQRTELTQCGKVAVPPEDPRPFELSKLG